MVAVPDFFEILTLVSSQALGKLEITTRVVLTKRGGREKGRRREGRQSVCEEDQEVWRRERSPKNVFFSVDPPAPEKDRGRKRGGGGRMYFFLVGASPCCGCPLSLSLSLSLSSSCRSFYSLLSSLVIFLLTSLLLLFLLFFSFLLLQVLSSFWYEKIIYVIRIQGKSHSSPLSHTPSNLQHFK